MGLRPRRAGAIAAAADRQANPPQPGTAPEYASKSGPSAAFIEQLSAAARAKHVPLAPLGTILARLTKAGISDAEIAPRLLVATDQLETLRASLANWLETGPGHGQACAEALACLDRGDLDAASEALKLGRESYWALPSPTGRAEAELYARQAVIDHLQGRFCDAAGKYAAAAALTADCGGREAWRYLIEQARELCEDGREFDNRKSLLLAVDICHRALGFVPRKECPHEWATTKYRLANALLLLGERGHDSARLKEAVDSYLAAIEEWDREEVPHDWAKAQSDLGLALQALGEQEDDRELLRQAAEAYRAALSRWPREADVLGWARAQHRLGDVLAVLGVEEADGERLIEAVAAYKEALNGVSRDIAPIDWALIQNNLGNALQALSETEATSARLHQAVAAYKEAVQDEFLAPSSLAIVKNNLGNALTAIGERENDAAKLEEAASTFRAALESHPLDAAPLDAAKILMNLAYALGALWNRTRNRQRLIEALGAVETAIGLSEGLAEQDDLAAELARQTILAAMGSDPAAAMQGA